MKMTTNSVKSKFEMKSACGINQVLLYNITLLLRILLHSNCRKNLRRLKIYATYHLDFFDL